MVILSAFVLSQMQETVVLQDYLRQQDGERSLEKSSMAARETGHNKCMER
jgi:hypothetical protein